MPKTATTWLQEILARESKILCLGRPNHKTAQFKQLRYALVDEEDETLAIQQIEVAFAAIEQSHSAIVLSDETLFANASHRTIARRLFAVVGPLNVLITTREPVAAILSLYRAHGREFKGAPAPFRGKLVRWDAYFDWKFNGREPPRHFNLGRAIAGYKDHAATIEILPYEYLQKDPDGYLERLRNFIGVDLEDIHFEPRNESNQRGSRLRYRLADLLTAGRYLDSTPSDKQKKMIASAYGPYEVEARTITGNAGRES